MAFSLCDPSLEQQATRLSKDNWKVKWCDKVKISRFIKNILLTFAFNEEKHLSRAFESLPGNLPLGLIDVGAAGGIETRWKKIQPYINYSGFEPDTRSFDLLSAPSGDDPSKTIFPVALWNKSQSLKINMCRSPQVSSHFYPNRDYLDKFPEKERFDIESKEEVQATRLDDLEIASRDFIKLDVQGGELSVLQGATNSLAHCLGLEVEVEFLCMYNKQPLFGDISQFLANCDFEFIDFTNICRWERHAFTGFGQAVFGDALFLKPPEIVFSANYDDDVASNYLKILLIYRRFDLIDRTLELLHATEKTKFDAFKTCISPIRKQFDKAGFVASLSSRFLRFMGEDYKNHLIH